MSSLAKILFVVDNVTPRGAATARTRLAGERIQVAAVCYRIRGDEPEFLLVRTRGGRWTFPKGSVDDDPTHAAAAAREAYEEAGVKGRIDHDPFHWYFHSKRERFRSHRDLVAVQAHLCEVESLVEPKEGHRNPTWFKAGKARRRLLLNRSPELALEVLDVLDRAVDRIRTRALARRIA